MLDDLFELTAISSRSSEKLKLINDINPKKKYVGYQAIIDDEEIDAVYIPIPNSMHYEWAKKSLESGKHVLVEKSLCSCFSEVKELISIAKKNNKVLMENFQFRFHPQTSFLKKILDDGIIGEIRSLKASFGFPPFKSKNNIRYFKSLGGGALLDAGAYTVKISQILLGTKLKVKSSSLMKDKNHEVEIWGGAHLENKNDGVFSQLAFGFDNFYKCGVDIWGSKGTLSTNRLFTAPEDLKPEFEIKNNNGNKLLKCESANHFKLMLIHFYKLITTGVDLEYENTYNLDQARLLFEIRNKANEK